MSKQKTKPVWAAPTHNEVLQKMAAGLDTFFNCDDQGDDRAIGFLTLIFPFDDAERRCDFITNCENIGATILILKAIIAKIEGNTHQPGNA